jgi:hypothetical protein
MKLAVIIPSHSSPKVTLLTVGTLLRTHSTHDLNLHVGVHTNYAHYTSDMSLFQALKGIAQIHLVDEIDWAAYNTCVYRYSMMHATNLANLIKQTQYYDFDYLLILDNDVYVRQDLTALAQDGADIITALFNDRSAPWAFSQVDGAQRYALPKPTVWHMLLSKRAVSFLAANPTCMFPAEYAGGDGSTRVALADCYGLQESYPIFCDTMSGFLHLCRMPTSTGWPTGLRLQIVPSSTLAGYAEHRFVSSFNYGSHTLPATYAQRIADMIETFDAEFPDGLRGLRGAGSSGAAT